MPRFGHLRLHGLLLAVLAAAHSATTHSATTHAATETGIALKHLWTHDAGGAARAEIVAYDAAAREFLVVNGDERCVMRLDATTGRETGRLDVRALGDPTSVAASHGLIAVAVVAPRKTDPGHVALFRSPADEKSDGAAASATIVRVGALPDMVTFTPNGRYVLVAVEGEPTDDYAVDPEGAVGVIDVGGGIEQPISLSADFARFNAERESLERSGVRINGPSAMAADGRTTVAADVEPEYIAVAPDGRTAWVTLQENNALATLDIPTAQIKRIVGLGLKDHSQRSQGIDANDRDGIHIHRAPVLGMYQPDSIAAFAADGATYLVTANEGDARGYSGFADEVRVQDLKLDAALKVDDNLKRLKVSSVSGDTDGDGDADRLLAFGTRSLAIWDAEGKLVYDSGDALEQFIATRMPDRFNIDSDGKGSVDDRSDDKGPEPEGIAVGRIGDATYAFVGLERTSAIAVFDVTQPRSVKLLDIVPLAFEKGTEVGAHIAPEGLCFVPADRSPLGAPLLAVACEVTGTTVLFRVDSVAGQ